MKKILSTLYVLTFLFLVLFIISFLSVFITGAWTPHRVEVLESQPENVSVYIRQTSLVPMFNSTHDKYLYISIGDKNYSVEDSSLNVEGWKLPDSIFDSNKFRIYGVLREKGYDDRFTYLNVDIKGKINYDYMYFLLKDLGIFYFPFFIISLIAMIVVKKKYKRKSNKKT